MNRIATAFLLCSAFTAATVGAEDPALRPLAIAPTHMVEIPGPVEIAGRKVEWFHHPMDPAWNSKKPDAIRRFAVLHPVEGMEPAEGAPLILDLHSHGYSVVSLVKTLDKPGNHDIWKGPPEYFLLVPDCAPRPPKESPDFWWCCWDHFSMPTAQGLADTGLDLSACEKRVLDTLEWTIRTYKIDRNRVYVCGNSMGGQGALGIGLNHGDIFAAIKANVPAGVWFATTRMGMTDGEGNDVPLHDIPFSRFPDPPVCVEYSSPADKWSKDHEVLIRNMERCRYSLLSYWGNFHHAHADEAVLHCNDIVHSFDWLSVRLNEAYAVFTHADCDDTLPWGRFPDAGTDRFSGDISPGQINAYFRWKSKVDEPDRFAMDLWVMSEEELDSTMFTPPAKAKADVSLRRLQRFPHAPGSRFAWTYGAASGEVEADENGLLTLPGLTLSQTHATLELKPLSGAPQP